MTQALRIAAATIALGAAMAIPAARGQEFSIPAPLAAEHRALHSRMEAATQAGGRVGEAARAVMTVLEPHFQKEERYAMPQLGLLPQAAGAPFGQGVDGLPPQLRNDLVTRTERLRAELPQMLEEHRAIAAALETLERAAQQEGQAEYAALAREIRHHAETEELLLYPAALLVGDYAARAPAVGR